MEAKVTTFTYGGQNVRTHLDPDGSVWFAATDVCATLSLAKTDTSVASLDDDEKGTHTMGTPGGPQKLTCVNEAGLYRLIFKSRKAEAKAFQRWVTHEVLPSIRRTGGYTQVPGVTLTPELQQRIKRLLEVADRVGLKHREYLQAKREMDGLRTELGNSLPQVLHDLLYQLNPENPVGRGEQIAYANLDARAISTTANATN